MNTATDATRIDDADSFAKMSEDEIAGWISEALELPSNFGSTDERFRHCTDRSWSLGPVFRTRDSGVRDRANADAIVSYLESDPTLADDWEVFGASHWACGWVDHLAFKVLDESGEITRIARVVKGIFDSLSDYPVFCDTTLSEYEVNDENDAWENYGAGDLVDGINRIHGVDLSDMPEENLWQMWRNIMERGNMYVEHTSEGPDLQINECVQMWTESDIVFDE